jgi:putative long chain acyl-CoA synthase
VEERFAPARVFELYASTRSDAILGNVADRKIGATGRPLPGTPQVRIVQVDTATGTPVIGPDGYAVPTPTGRTGLLLVAARPGRHTGNDVPLRGVFSPDDAWISTGDLFRADADGDLWHADSLAALVHTESGVVSPRAIEDALGGLDAVDLACCYPTADGTVYAAVTLRPGAALVAADLDRALTGIEPTARPDRIHVVDAIPTTSWHRPAIGDLRSGAGSVTGGWALDRTTGCYRG